jgi:hypothetical protein
MRARAKFALVPQKASALVRAEGMNDEQWRALSEAHTRFIEETNRMLQERLFGRPLPFSRTPRGTVGFPWFDFSGRLLYETDLSPKNDEASVSLFSIFPLDEMARKQLEDSKTLVTPGGTKIVAFRVGGTAGAVTNPSEGGTAVWDLAVKFWITAENLSGDFSRVYHIEVPGSADTILCTLIEKGAKDYNEFETLFSS